MISVEQKNKMAYIILLLASLLIAVIGGTYAYFTAGMSTGETQATLKVGAGQLKIKFANTNSVQIAENVQPTVAKTECTKKTGAYYCDQSQYTPVGTKTFTLTGTNTTDASKNMKMPYNIKLIIPQNQFSSGALKYTLIGSKEANDNGKVVNIDTWKDIPTGANTTGTVLGSGYFMPGENMIHTYTFNIYFPDNHISQDADKNRIFGAKIEITTDEIEEENTIAAPTGWNEAKDGTLLASLRNNTEISKPISIPGKEVSAHTLDDVPSQTTSVSTTRRAYYITYGTGWEANGTKFNLTGASVTSDTYANSYSSLVGKYLISSYIWDTGSSTAGEMQTTTDLDGVYYVVSATQNSFTYKQITSVKNVSEAIVASAEDDYGTSYYFRGAVTNNYVQFANKCWRIVRVGGDGSVKLILHNDNTAGAANPCNSTNNSTSAAFARYSGTTYKSNFNTNCNDNAYVGFKYGTAGAGDYATTHANTNKSTILTNLETWYNNNLKTYESVIDNSVWCNDKTNVTDTTYNPWNMSNVNGLGYGKNETYYGAMQRLVSTSNSAGGTGPSLKCNGELSKITSKVGLITADELAFAGYAEGLGNTTTYLQENATDDGWWSLSPNVFDVSCAGVWRVDGSNGRFGFNYVNDIDGGRPSISLKSTTNVSGDGTSSSPYIISM